MTVNHSQAEGRGRAGDGMPADGQPAVNPSLKAQHKRVKETPEYLGMVRRMLTAAGERVAREADPELLAELAYTVGYADAAMRTAVEGLRGAGYTWAQIGAAMGTSAQAAHKRWAKAPASALEQFHDALRGLHVQAGRPGSRVIANRAGSVSHSTVARAMRERQILPTWPVTGKIVTQLGGDLEQFRQLWEAAGGVTGERNRA